MNILQVVHGLPPDSHAGTELYTANLSGELLTLGHTVDIFYRVDKPKQPNYALTTTTRDGLTLHAINNPLKNQTAFERIYRNPYVADAFATTVQKTKPDMVHLQHLTLLSSDLVEVCHDHRVPVVMTLHDYWMICQQGQLHHTDGTHCDGPVEAACNRCLRSAASFSSVTAKAGRLLDKVVPGFSSQGSRLRAVARAGASRVAELTTRSSEEMARITLRQNHLRRMLGLVDRFVSHSEYVRQKYIAFGVPAEKIVPMELGIDTRFAASIQRVPTGPVRFGYLGALMKSKGVITLLDAFERIDPTRATLSLHGAPAESLDLAAVQAALKQSNAKITGPFTMEQKGAVLEQIDVLVVPSEWQENAPAVILEAFAAGIPVIASRIGGIPEMIQNNENGLLVEPGDPAALTDAMTRLCDRQQIDQLVANLPTVRTLADNVIAYDALYQEVKQLYRPPSDAALREENQRLLEADMEHGATVWESRPAMLEMSTNNVCDLECIMCAPEGHVSPTSLLKDEVQAFASFIFPAGSVLTPSAGSEPFLGNIKLMNELCERYGVQLNLITNGNFLTEAAFDELKHNLGRIQVSLDSNDPAVYAKIRRGGNFAQVDKNLRAVVPRARAEGIEVLFSGVIATDTIAKMADFVRYGSEVGASAIAFQRLIYIVEGVEDLDPYESYEPAVIAAHLEAARVAAEECKITLHIDDGQPHIYRYGTTDSREYLHDRLSNRFLAEHPGFCYMAAMYMKIDSDGTVYPCCRGSEQIVMGNARQQSLREIWNGKEWQALRQEMATGNLRPWCQECPFHTLTPEPVTSDPSETR